MTDTLLLFDIDGTLLDTAGAGKRAMTTVARQLFGQNFTFDHTPFAGMLDPLIYQHAATVNNLHNPQEHHDRFRDAYLPQLAHEINTNPHDVATCPGIHALLEAVVQHQHRARADQHTITLGLLTGNYGQAARLKLQAVGIDPALFTLTAFGDEAPTRPELVALAIQRFQQQHQRTIHPRRVYVIGDTHHDVLCAKAHGCTSIAVATGRATHQELQQHHPDALYHDLTDAQHFLQHLHPPHPPHPLLTPTLSESASEASGSCARGSRE